MFKDVQSDLIEVASTYVGISMKLSFGAPSSLVLRPLGFGPWLLLVAAQTNGVAG